MALDKLLAALEADARAQAERLLAEARDEAARITGTAETRIEARRRDVLGARETERRATAEQQLGTARHSARRGVLEARQRLLDRVFSAASDLLGSPPTQDSYARALPRHLADALACAGDGPVEIRCPPALAAAIRGLAKDRAQVTVVADPTAAPGFTVRARDGAIEIDSTLAARLERARPRLAIEAVRALEAAP